MKRGNPGMTLIKRDSLSCASGTSGSGIEVDLGLGIGEAARILAVDINVYSKLITSGEIHRTHGGYSFDLDDADLDVLMANDDVFALVSAGAAFITDGGANTGQSRMLDFTQMNLITTRNVKMLVQHCGTGSIGYCDAAIYYEKFTPTTNEMVELLSRR